MIEKLQTMYRRLMERLRHNEAKDRGPIAPVRVAPKPLRAPEPPRTDTTQAREQVTPTPKIVSRGNNKNVYVLADGDKDPEELLRKLDSESVIEIHDDSESKPIREMGVDPYNSGSYTTKQIWRD